MMMMTESNNGMGSGKTGKSEQDNNQDPYWHIRQRPAHLLSTSSATSASGNAMITNGSHSSSSSRNSMRDRGGGTSASSSSNHSRM